MLSCCFFLELLDRKCTRAADATGGKTIPLLWGAKLQLAPLTAKRQIDFQPRALPKSPSLGAAKPAKRPCEGKVSENSFRFFMIYMPHISAENARREDNLLPREKVKSSLPVWQYGFFCVNLGKMSGNSPELPFFVDFSHRDAHPGETACASRRNSPYSC